MGHDAWPSVAFGEALTLRKGFCSGTVAAIQVAIVPVLIPLSHPGGVCFTSLVTYVVLYVLWCFPICYAQTHCLCFYCQVQTNCLLKSRNWLCDFFVSLGSQCVKTCLWIQVTYSMSNLIFVLFYMCPSFLKNLIICEFCISSFPHGCFKFSWQNYYPVDTCSGNV